MGAVSIVWAAVIAPHLLTPCGGIRLGAWRGVRRARGVSGWAWKLGWQLGSKSVSGYVEGSAVSKNLRVDRRWWWNCWLVGWVLAVAVFVWVQSVWWVVVSDDGRSVAVVCCSVSRSNSVRLRQD